MTPPSPSDAFEAQRARLFSLAYRMLGSAADAEDILQEAWLRFEAAEAGSIASPAAWLSTVVTRLCLDQLKSARARRERYVGPWLPEPLLTAAPPDVESISMAFLVVLEQLSPAERAAYLLHDVFDYSHAEVAAMLDMTEANSRQLALRARTHLRAERPRFSASPERHSMLLMQFLTAIQNGDWDALQHVLCEDVVLHSDGGGKATAARKPIFGSDRVARFFLGLWSKAKPEDEYDFRIIEANGLPSLLALRGGRPLFVMCLEADGDRIRSIFSVLNPDKLRGVVVPETVHKPEITLHPIDPTLKDRPSPELD